VEEQIAALPEPPVAIEAFWDGDTQGWFVTLTAIIKTASGYRDHFLTCLNEGGDIRLFNGQVPPCPEAQFAQQFGQEIATQFGVVFYFPSPNHPEDDCPRFWDREQGYPCRRCGIPLLQRADTPWRGVCYFCHLAEEREQREAQWTPEERAGPRCHICGAPAKGLLGSSHVCLVCLEEYRDIRCASCGVTVRTSETITDPEHYLCLRCHRLAQLAAVTEDQRQALRTVTRSAHPADAAREIRRVLDVGLHDSYWLVEYLKQPAES
jgi:hypothetical protein